MSLGELVRPIIKTIAALSVLGALMLLVKSSYRPIYDQSDPNYGRYLEVFNRLRPDLDYRGATKDDFIDLSDLNNGEWKTACLFGGYTSPLDTMRTLGANVAEKDRARLTEAGSRGFRLAQVEEQEMAIAFVDLGNNARFIHFRSGIGPEGQNLKRCISKPETRLSLVP